MDKERIRGLKLKDRRGVWVKHGAPSETPDYVAEQQEVISDVLELYSDAKNSGMELEKL